MAEAIQNTRISASNSPAIRAELGSATMPGTKALSVLARQNADDTDDTMSDASLQPAEAILAFEDQFAQLVLADEHVLILDSLEGNEPVPLFWDGQRYVDDRGGRCIKDKIRKRLAQYMAQAVRQISMGAVGDVLVIESTTIYKSQVDRYLESPGYGNHLVQEVFRSIRERPELARLEEDFDCDPLMINTPEGYLDLRTLERLEHDPTQMVRNMTRADFIDEGDGQEHLAKYLSIIQSAIYDKEKTPVENDEMLESAIGLIAESLCGDNVYKIIPCFVGPTNSGKSTELYIREKCLGDYAVSINAKGLLKTARSNLDIRPDIVKVRNARLISAVETEKADIFDSRLLKSLSGNDELSFRRPHRDTVHFHLKGKIFLATNELPRLSDIEDAAFLKRLVTIGFKNSVPDSMIDGDLKSKLTQKRAMDEIFSYLVRAASRQIASQSIMISPAFVALKNRFILERSDIVKRFWDERVIVRPETEFSAFQPKYPSRIIYASSFVPYCYANGLEPPTITAWGTRFYEIASLFPGVQREGGGREPIYYVGIDVKLRDKYALSREAINDYIECVVGGNQGGGQ